MCGRRGWWSWYYDGKGVEEGGDGAGSMMARVWKKGGGGAGSMMVRVWKRGCWRW